MKRGLIWLASYPKSGNTWFRIFLTNLKKNGDAPACINQLGKIPIASARGLFDEAAGIEASDLTDEEIDRLRPELYLHLAENAEEPLFMKVHDAYTHVHDHLPLIPGNATDCAIYFIRNPLDVAVSFAHHSSWTYEKSIENMADASFAFCGKADRLHNQLRQKLLSWSGHVISWVDRAPFPVCVLRYEDMMKKPMETFSRAIRFARLEYTPEQIQKALAFSSFDVLQKQEEAEGFHEKSPSESPFFRKGEIGSWQAELTDLQARQIVRDHQDVMRRFGYLDDEGKAVF